MNALVLANRIDAELIRTVEIDILHSDTADMLRRQHEAIVKLREAVGGLLNDNSDEYIPSRLWDNARQALKDTEEFK